MFNFPTIFRLLLGMFLLQAMSLHACPWCDVNPSMKPTVNVADANPGGKYFGEQPDPARVKRYFIAAEYDQWDYLPDGKDPVMGSPIPPQVLESPKSGKCRYFQYTDDTFTARVLPTERLGIFGPVMRGVTGDFIVVTLLNRLSAPVSLHPHGVRYDKDSEGSAYLTAKGLGSSIAPQARFTYVWKCDEASAPGPAEPSSKPWLYHSHVQGDSEINAGLSGFIIVTDAARARPDGTPADVDREMALLFENYDESGFTEAQEYAGQVVVDGKAPDGGPAPAIVPWEETQAIKELAMRSALNGRVFGNLHGLEMIDGERVRWYVFALGTVPDVHTAHWHGERLKDAAGRMTDTIELSPGTMKCADMLADNPGDWMIHCHVGDHMMEGMYANFSVLKKDALPPKEAPFFGITSAMKSVAWQTVEANLDPADFHFTARCTVTAYAQLALWNTHLGLSIGKQTAATRLDKSGHGNANGVTFKVLNGDASGVVVSDRLEIEIQSNAPEWLAVVRENLATSKNTALHLELKVDDTAHSTEIPLKITGNQAVLAH